VYVAEKEARQGSVALRLASYDVDGAIFALAM